MSTALFSNPVPRLSLDGMLFEIEAIAALPS